MVRRRPTPDKTRSSWIAPGSQAHVNRMDLPGMRQQDSTGHGKSQTAATESYPPMGAANCAWYSSA